MWWEFVLYVYSQAEGEYVEDGEEWCSDEEVSHETQSKVSQYMYLD